MKSPTLASVTFPSPDEAALVAEEKFRSGYNCAQSVFCTFAPALGMDEDMAKKVSLALGGGMCRMREVCGTVSGMLMALGLLEGIEEEPAKEIKDSAYAHGQLLAGRFREKNGSILCRELLALGRKESVTKTENPFSPVSEERTESYYKKRPCAELCASAARIFAEYLSEKAVSEA